MHLAVAAPLLLLSLLLTLGIGGCASYSYKEFHDERHGRVITDATKKLEGNPHDAGLYASRGKAFFCTRRYEKAIADFNKAIEIDPINAMAYRGRGIASRIVDNQALPAGSVINGPHKGFVEDTNTANILDPGWLDAEINQGFGYISNVTNEFIYPVTGYCVEGTRDLILGSTTTTQAAEMLPPKDFTSHGARRFTGKGDKPRIGKVGKVVENVRSFYKADYGTLPEVTMIFDKNDKLVVIRNVDQMHLDKGFNIHLGKAGNERLGRIGRKRFEKYQDLMRQYQFTEVYRDKKDLKYGYEFSDKTMRAEITPCVTLDIGMRIVPKSTTVMFVTEYIYTCPTK